MKRNGSMKDQMKGLAITIAPVTVEKKRDKKMSGGKTMKPSKTSYTYKEGGRVMYAEGGKGIEALRKEAPEVVARMGYGLGGVASKLAKILFKTGKGKEVKIKKLTQKELEADLKNLEREQDRLMDLEQSSSEGLKGAELDFSYEIEDLAEDTIRRLQRDYPESKTLKDYLKNENDTLENSYQNNFEKNAEASFLNEKYDYMGTKDPTPSFFDKDETTINRIEKRKGWRKQSNEELSEERLKQAEQDAEEGFNYREPDDNVPFAEGGDVDAQMAMMMPMEKTMMPAEETMMPDEQMEDEYLDFIVSQSLSSEEEMSLMNKLEADPELSVMFDKLMDTATEFSGSGPVDGPGSEVSDSIPARLSDGEFVFTAKATEQLGADRLQSMMEDAEAEADVGRQEAAQGGEMDKEKVDQYGKPVDEDIAEDEIRKGMLSVNPRLQ